MSSILKTSDDIWLSDSLESLTYRKNILKVSEYAEQNRVLPQELSPLPGKWSNEVAPYLTEIMDCFSENSPIQQVAVMKGAQLGLTTGVIENPLIYIVGHNPGPILYVSADQGVAEASIELKIDKALSSAGLGDKIFAQNDNRAKKRTGDTKKRKEFPGGFLLAIGPNSPAKLRTFSIKYLFFDEVDAYPVSAGKEGDPIALAKRRTDAFEQVRKICYISTPLELRTSKIEPLFEKGDKRRFYIPCVCCGEYQVLEWKNMKYETDNNHNLIWDSVGYKCSFCKKHMKNTDKHFFLKRGEWRPTAQAKEPFFRSYHLPSFYSPIGMRSWESICQEWIESRDHPAKLKTVINTVFGETFVERGEAPNYKKVMEKCDSYKKDFLNKNILILTAGVDVQKDRIEIEIVGWGRNKESWSINYHVIYATEKSGTINIEDKCWSQLEKLITKTYKLANGDKTSIMMCFIDSGYATNTVYHFSENFESGLYPIMGIPKSGIRKTLAIKKNKVTGFDTIRYDLVVDIFKDELASYLRKDRPLIGNIFPPGYCHFPRDYTDVYFKQLTAETKFLKSDSRGNEYYVWENRSKKRNEALDCRVYALAALYHILDAVSAELEKEENITWSQFWDHLEEEIKS